MADGLASLLASGYPTLPAETQALTAENALAVAQDPSRWQGQGIFGGLARQMALGQAQGQLQSAVPQIVAAHNEALPDLAAAYAAPDPYQWAANNPDASPLARAMILTQTPGQVAQAKDLISQAGYRGTLADLQRLTVLLKMRGMQMNPYATGGAATAPGTAPGTPASAAPTGGVPTTHVEVGSGHYPSGDTSGGSTTAPSGTAPNATAPPPLDLSKIPPAGPQRMQWLAQLRPAQRAYLLSRLSAPKAAAPAATPVP